jgi:hypothetical protein
MTKGTWFMLGVITILLIEWAGLTLAEHFLGCFGPNAGC